jgi:hypothetical protein
MNIMEIGLEGVNLIGLSKGRGWRWAVVDTVIKLRVP